MGRGQCCVRGRQAFGFTPFLPSACSSHLGPYKWTEANHSFMQNCTKPPAAANHWSCLMKMMLCKRTLFAGQPFLRAGISTKLDCHLSGGCHFTLVSAQDCSLHARREAKLNCALNNLSLQEPPGMKELQLNFSNSALHPPHGVAPWFSNTFGLEQCSITVNPRVALGHSTVGCRSALASDAEETDRSDALQEARGL